MAVRTGRRLGDEHLGWVFRSETLVGVASLAIRMMLGQMRVGSLDLHKAFTADGLVAASRAVEVRRIGEKADGALGCVLVEEDLEWLAVDKRIVG